MLMTPGRERPARSHLNRCGKAQRAPSRVARQSLFSWRRHSFRAPTNARRVERNHLSASDSARLKFTGKPGDDRPLAGYGCALDRYRERKFDARSKIAPCLRTRNDSALVSRSEFVRDRCELVASMFSIPVGST
jgi:hypothetical protein